MFLSKITFKSCLHICPKLMNNISAQLKQFYSLPAELTPVEMLKTAIIFTSPHARSRANIFLPSPVSRHNVLQMSYFLLFVQFWKNFLYLFANETMIKQGACVTWHELPSKVIFCYHILFFLFFSFSN